MSYRDASIDQFVSGIASTDLTPAGGTAAAVVAAIGTGVCEMVCIHAAQDREGSNREDIVEIRRGLEHERRRFFELAQRDAGVVEDMYGSSSAKPEKGAGDRLVGVPLTMGEHCVAVLEYGRDTVEVTDQDVVADALTGMCLVHGALTACVHTVRWNLHDPTGISQPDVIEERIQSAEAKGDDLFRQAKSVFETV